MTPAQINRRRALAVVAAVPAATALGGAAFPTDEPESWPRSCGAKLLDE
jgi:hypothetical protein